MEREYFIEYAKQLGADHAVLFNIEDIEFDSRTILKCMFGCSDWGKGCTCPSREGSLMPWEYKEVLSRYKWGLIIHSNSKEISQKVSFEIERNAFMKGYYFAFSMSDCALCSECAGSRGKDCLHPDKARPAFHSVGIDVFKTVHKFGLPLYTLQAPGDGQNWYSAVFIE